ncbi:MAG: hypothetical protein K6U80_10730 [Firmicutes bacterium]|nr:hypothetical protein [Bacillota bacterium]
MGNNELVVANYRLYLNGSEFSPELLAAIESITVEDELNLPAMFAIKLNIVDFDKGDWRWIGLEAVKPGDVVKIFMGVDTPAEMMTGEITSLEVAFGAYCYMEIRGYDRLHRLRFGTKRRSFKDMKDSDIAAKIANEAGLLPQIEDTGTVIPYLFQNNQSNYEFLLERGRRLGYEMLVNDKTFYFRKSQEGKAPELTLEYNLDFDSFTAQMRALTEGSEVEVRGWGVKDKKEITATAKSGSETSAMAGLETGYKLSQTAFGDFPVAVIDEAVIDESDAGKIAKAKYNTLLKEFITGEGTCLGNPSIRAGKTVELKGIGTRFSGPYYLAATVHSINEEGYKTTFKVKRTGI